MADSGLNVVVRFIGDASSVQSEAAKIESTGGKIKAWATGVGAALGGMFVIDQLKQATDAAAELADQVGASTVVFGEGADEVQRFAQTTANAFGIAESDALNAANTFGAFGKSAGLAGDDLAGFSTQMVALAGDLSSLRGGKPEEAITAIGAALRGESEPIRRYGVLLDDATLKARAMKMGLISTTTEALQPQAKVLAAQAEILAQTGDAQGDFARTSDSAANQQKKMAANMKEAQAALGTALLPALQAILPVLTKLAKLFADHADVLVPLAVAIAALVAVTWAWNAALAANPVVLIAIGIALVIAAIVLLIQNFDQVKEVALAVWDAIYGAILFVWEWIQANWPLLLAILTGPIGVAVLLIVNNWNTIKDALAAAVDFMVGLWNTFVGFVTSIPGKIAAALAAVGGFIVNAFKAGVDGVWNLVTGLVGWFIDLPGRIIDALGSLGGRMYAKAVDAMQDFLHGLESMMGKIASKVGNFVGDILGKLNPLGSPQTVAYYRGRDVMRDYVAGAESVQKGTVAAFNTLGTTAAGATAPSAAGSHSTFNINVSVGAGAQPAEVGAAVVDQIRQYERIAGKVVALMTTTELYEPRTIEREGPLLDIDYHVGLTFYGEETIGGVPRWDYAVWDDPGAVWTDTVLLPLQEVTCNVLSVTLNEGRDLPLERFRPGTASVVLYDPNGEFSPWLNAENPTAVGTIRVGIDLGVWAVSGGVTYPRFRGIVDSIKDAFPETGRQHTVRFDAFDYLSVLAAYDGPEQAAQGAGELPGARLHRILDNAQYVGPRALDAGSIQLQATTLAKNALDEAGLTMDTETGSFWCNRAGTLVFRQRDAVLLDPLYTTVQAIFGDDDDSGDDEICYTDIELTSDTDKIKNVVSISNVGGTAVVVSDETSIALYRPRTFNRHDLIHLNPADSVTIASRHLLFYAYASNRVERLEIDMAALSHAQRLAVLKLDVLYRIEVRRRAEGFQVVTELQLQGITERVTADTWTISFRTFPALTYTTQAGWDSAVWDTGELGLLTEGARHG